MIRFHTLTVNRSGVARHDTMEGVDYLVVPMVMLTEGVHNGSSGPELYENEELSKYVEAWNTKPIVVYHPMDNGKPISACQPIVLTKQKVGLIMNTKFKKGKGKGAVGKLHAEAWLNQARLEEIDPRILQAIESDEMMELSTGLFSDLEESDGEWNGEQYNGIIRNIRPDHLALLPDKKGACSIDDGAGFLRVNAEGELIGGCLLTAAARRIRDRIKTNDMSFSDISSAVSSRLRDELGDDWGGWTEDVFPDYAVYYEGGKLYKQDYHLSGSQVTLIGSPVEVVQDTTYVVVQNTETNPKKEKAVDKAKAIDSLISNGAWKETDREWLTTLEDNKLENLVTLSTKKTEEKKDPPKEDPVIKDNAAKDTPQQKKMTTEEYIANAPPDIADSLREGLAKNNQEREELIATITANENNIFQKEELALETTPRLRGLARLAKAQESEPANYGRRPSYLGAAGGGANPTVNQMEALGMPELDFSSN